MCIVQVLYLFQDIFSPPSFLLRIPSLPQPSNKVNLKAGLKKAMSARKRQPGGNQEPLSQCFKQCSLVPPQTPSPPSLPPSLPCFFPLPPSLPPPPFLVPSPAASIPFHSPPCSFPLPTSLLPTSSFVPLSISRRLQFLHSLYLITAPSFIKQLLQKEFLQL